MENPLLVFISSVISGTNAERQVAEAAIRAIPLSRPWVFEHAPASSLPLAESYLSKVRACDIFVMILRDTPTDPVKLEVTTAQSAGKPILVFLSASAPPETIDCARSFGVKYATYDDTPDLAQRVAEAVADELIRGYREHQVLRADVSRLAEFLDALDQGQTMEKQRADELEYAQLLEDNVPAAPIYSELDGGMNKVFLARFPDRVTLSRRLGLDLTQGAFVGELMSMSISYAKRFENSYYRPDTKWAYVIMFDPSQRRRTIANSTSVPTISTRP